MNDRSIPPAPEEPGHGRDRLVYVVPSDAELVYDARTGGLLEVWRVLREGMWTIAVATGLLVAIAIAYALLTEKWYRAEVVLVPAETQPGASGLADQLGGFSGLAGLAGISLGGSNTAEPLAVLNSRGFAQSFIEQNNLLPLLFADKWDRAAGRWKESGREPPDMHDAVRKFTEKVLRVDQEQKTKLVTVRIDWTDPRLAAQWANALVDKLNDRMRERALREAETNVAYLKQELSTADVVTLQQSIGRLMQNELQKAMLARGNKEFAFKIVDSAVPPKWRVWPKRAQIVALAGVLGLVLSGAWVLARHRIRTGGEPAR